MSRTWEKPGAMDWTGMVHSQLWQRKTRIKRMMASRKSSAAESWFYYLLMQKVAMYCSRKICLCLSHIWSTLKMVFSSCPFSFCISGRGQWYGSMDSNHDDELRRGGSLVCYHVTSFFLFKNSKSFKRLYCEKIEWKHESEISIVHQSAKIKLSKLDFYNLSSKYLALELAATGTKVLAPAAFSVQLGTGAMTRHSGSSDLDLLVVGEEENLKTFLSVYCQKSRNCEWFWFSCICSWGFLFFND